jgi:hypothetical protein
MNGRSLGRPKEAREVTMRKFTLILSLAVLVLFTFSTISVAADHEYVGVFKCKMCHKKESTGDQYGIWLKSAHAKAYTTLASDEAKAVAAKLKLEGNPQELDECLGCHVTAHGVDAKLLGTKYTVEDGVGCESCHGPGADYMKRSVMKDKKQAIAAGLIIPDEKTCIMCHNEKSPTYKKFDYKTFYAKIAHTIPPQE